VAATKTMKVNGPLHTIISDLTFMRRGKYDRRRRPIDAAAFLNTVGGAKPGGFDPSGTGSVNADRHVEFSVATLPHKGGAGTLLHHSGRRRKPITFNGRFLRRRHDSNFNSSSVTIGRRRLELLGALVSSAGVPAEVCAAL